MTEKAKKKVSGFQDLGVLLSDMPAQKVKQKKGDLRQIQSETQNTSKNSEGGSGGIELSRTIKVQCWRVVGQVAKAEKRDDLIPVLLRARELGSTNTKDLDQHLLGGSRRVVAQRLLYICELYGLLEQADREYSLTESGETALKSKQVFVPEQGTWTVWASNDPLLLSPILRIDPWSEPTAYDELRGGKDTREFEKLPRWLLGTTGEIVVPVGSRGGPIRIDQLEPKGEVVEPLAKLTGNWAVSSSRLRLTGSINEVVVDSAISAPELNPDEVWQQLLESEELWPYWDAELCALQVRFEHTTPTERESFLRAQVFSSPAIAGLGEFNEAIVEGVRLRPGHASDAQTWAEWRLGSRINDYATAERMEAWVNDAQEHLLEFHPSLPRRHDLAAKTWAPGTDRPTPKTWYLVAAEDWSL